MDVTQKAVRVYGSTAYLSDSQQSPRHVDRVISIDPDILTDSGLQGRVSIHLGHPVPWVVEALQIRRAIGTLTLNVFFRGQSVQTSVETAIDEILSHDDQQDVWQDSWYVTLVVEADVTVPDSAINGNKYAWLEDNVYVRAENFSQIASPHLDRLALLTSTVISPSAFEKLLISDHVYFTAPNRKPFGMPKGGLTGRLGIVSSPASSLDLPLLERRLRQGTTLSNDAANWLRLVTSWWLAGLREEDPWRAFAQLFTGLELLHGSLVKRYYNYVVHSARVTASDQATRQKSPLLAALLDSHDKTKISKRKDLSERGEFAVIALALFPHLADADYTTFDRIKQLRNDVAHGHKTVAETPFPVSELRDLFARYLTAAIQNDK